MQRISATTRATARARHSADSRRRGASRSSAGHWRWSAIGQAISPGLRGERHRLSAQLRLADRARLTAVRGVSSEHALPHVEREHQPARRRLELRRRAARGGWHDERERHVPQRMGAHGERGSRARVALDGGAARRPSAAAPRAHDVGDDTEHRCAQAEAAHAQPRADSPTMAGSGNGATIGANIDTRDSDRVRIRLGPTFTSTSEPLQYVEHLDTAAPGSAADITRQTSAASCVDHCARRYRILATASRCSSTRNRSSDRPRYDGFAEVVQPRAASMDARVRRLDSWTGSQIRRSAHET